MDYSLLECRHSLFNKDSVFFEEDGDGNFGAVYMILVFAIAALLLVLIVKPMYQSAQKSIPKTTTK
ncbi:MAG: hypothetical protein WC821_00505 [archaeon]|jgi:hypothetical protein